MRDSAIAGCCRSRVKTGQGPNTLQLRGIAQRSSRGRLGRPSAARVASAAVCVASGQNWRSRQHRCVPIAGSSCRCAGRCAGLLRLRSACAGRIARRLSMHLSADVESERFCGTVESRLLASSLISRTAEDAAQHKVGSLMQLGQQQNLGIYTRAKLAASQARCATEGIELDSRTGGSCCSCIPIGSACD